MPSTKLLPWLLFSFQALAVSPFDGWQPPSEVRSTPAAPRAAGTFRSIPHETVLEGAPDLLELRKNGLLSHGLHLRSDQTASSSERSALAQMLRGLRDEPAGRDSALNVLGKMKGFAQAHAGSALAPSVQAEIGRRAVLLGDFPAAINAWKAVWKAGKAETLDVEMKHLADEACGRLAQLYRQTGQKTSLEQILTEVEGRALSYPAVELVKVSRQTLKKWLDHPQINVHCGIIAYNHLAEQAGKPSMVFQCEADADDPYRDPNEDMADFVLHGMSALVLKNRSVAAGWPLRVIRRGAGVSSVPWPCIVHFSWGPDAGHFSAVTGGDERRVVIKDDFMGLHHPVPLVVVNPQLSGYFLIPESSSVPAGFAEVSAAEATFVYGRGNDSPSGQKAEGCNPKKGGNCSNGMAVHTFTEYIPGLVIEDTPLTYMPRYGPAANLTLEYRQIDPLSVESIDGWEQTTNIGAGWHLGEGAYLRASDYGVLPAINDTSVPIEEMRWVNSDGTYFDYIVEGAIPAHKASRYRKSRPGLFLMYVSLGGQNVFAGYKLAFSDGSQMEFAQPASASGATRYYLSKKIDPQGLSLQFIYEFTPLNKIRLRKIEMADQQSPNRMPATPDTVPGILFEYEDAEGLRVSKIYDPFGRVAMMTYTAAAPSGLLASIKDAVGIVSSFTYDAGNPVEIRSYTTPYGTHRVAWGNVLRPGRSDLPPANVTFASTDGYYVSVTDPDGNEERIARLGLTRQATSDSGWPLWDTLLKNPGGTVSSKIYINPQDTRNQFKSVGEGYYFSTFHWTKKYWGEYLKAKAANQGTDPYDYAACDTWMNQDGLATHAPCMTKQPGRAPVWYNTETNFYDHNSLRSGDDNQVAKSARQIEGPDGIPKWVMTEESSTPQGLPDISVDELGRMVKRTYSSPPNSQVTPDLLAVHFYDGTTWKPLVTLAGHVNHQPRIITKYSDLRQDLTFNTTEQPTLIKASRNTDATTTSRIRATYDTLRDGAPPVWPGTPGLLRRIEKAAVPTGINDTARQWMVTDDYTYDTVDRVRTHTDATGYMLTFDYDNLDRITLVTHPDGSTEQFSYQRGLGAPATLVMALDLTAYKDRNGRWTRMAYNSIRQPELLLTPDGKSLQYAWCRCGSLWKLTDPMGRVTEWKRDILGRVTEKVRADGTTKTLYTYEPLSGRLKTVQPPDRAKVTYRYNLDGSLHQEDYDDAGLTPDVTYHYTTTINGTTFDPLGRLRFIQDGIGTTTLTYHDAVTSAPYNTTKGLYMLKLMDGPLGNDDQAFLFDDQDRVSDRDVQTDAAPPVDKRSEAYTWDGIGRLKTVINTLGTFTFNYTGAEKRVTSITRPNSVLSAYTYYPEGVTDPVTFQPRKNLQERLWTIRHSRTTTQYSKHTFDYDNAARLTSWQEEASGNPAPVANSYGYNSSDELTAHTSRWHPNGTVLEQGQWAYDDAGNFIATGDSSTMTTRTHDLKLNRLTRIGGSGRILVEGIASYYSAVTVRVGYGPVKQAMIVSDPAGGYRFQLEVDVQQGNNTITVTATALSPYTGQPDTSNPQVVTRQYQYQAAGISRHYVSSASRLLAEVNASSTTLRLFDYDAKNRLKKVTVSGTVTEWDYDYADRRVREWQYPEGGTKPAWPAKVYIWDGKQLVQERVCTSAATYTAGGTVSRTHYFGGFNDGITLSGTKYQTTTDHLGNVRDVINASGTLVARYDYNAWGKPTKVSGTTVNASLLINSRYYHHAASGLHLALYRAYDPDLGRWLSEDPLGEEGGLNLYGYVGNSPLIRFDELGLLPGLWSGDGNNNWATPRGAPTATPAQIAAILDSAKHLSDFDYGGKHGKCRYVNTRRGPVDLKHVFAGGMLPFSDYAIVPLTVLWEGVQLLSDNESAFAEEDLTSNAIGAKSGWPRTWPGCPSKTFGQEAAANINNLNINSGFYVR